MNVLNVNHHNLSHLHKNSQITTVFFAYDKKKIYVQIKLKN